MRHAATAPAVEEKKGELKEESDEGIDSASLTESLHYDLFIFIASCSYLVLVTGSLQQFLC